MKKIVVCPVCGTKYGKVDEIKGLELICFKCKSELVANVTISGVTVEVLNDVMYVESEKGSHRVSTPRT